MKDLYSIEFFTLGHWENLRYFDNYEDALTFAYAVKSSSKSSFSQDRLRIIRILKGF